MQELIQAWAEGVNASRGQAPSVSPYKHDPELDAAWQRGYRGEPFQFIATLEE